MVGNIPTRAAAAVAAGTEATLAGALKLFSVLASLIIEAKSKSNPLEVQNCFGSLTSVIVPVGEVIGESFPLWVPTIFDILCR